MRLQTGIVILGAIALGQSASGGVIYAVYANNGTSASQLYAINPTTLAVAPIGSTGQSGQYGSMAYDTLNNTMYWTPGSGNFNLYSLNLSTGASTLVGALGTATAMTGMAYDPNANQMFGFTDGLSDLYRLNLATGAATLVGANSQGTGVGMTYNTNLNELVLINVDQSFYSLNESTGAATQLHGAASTGINVSGIAFDPDRNVYWVDSVLGSLFQYSTSTYAQTTEIVGLPSESEIGYVASQGTTSAAPEPGSFGLLAAGSAALLVWTRRRRR